MDRRREAFGHLTLQQPQLHLGFRANDYETTVFSNPSPREKHDISTSFISGISYQTPAPQVGSSYYNSIEPFLGHLMDTPYVPPSPHGSNPSSFTKSASSKRVRETLDYWQKKPGCKTELTIIKACQLIAHCLAMQEPDGSSLVNRRIDGIFEEMKTFFAGRKTQLGECSHLWPWIQLIICSRLCSRTRLRH